MKEVGSVRRGRSEQTNSLTYGHRSAMADRTMKFLRDLLADLEQIEDERPASQT